MITIAILNNATIPLGCDFNALVQALQVYLNQHFLPVWSQVGPVKLMTEKAPGAWVMEFLDDADVEGAEGYHDVESNLPHAKVFVRTTQQVGDLISVTASHELAEMLVDPTANLWVNAPDGTQWAYETADAVEENAFHVNGIPMSDFVYPAYFQPFRDGVQFDHLKLITRPFEILRGGYSTIRDPHTGEVKEIFGSPEKRARFAKEDRRDHRSTWRRDY